MDRSTSEITSSAAVVLTTLSADADAAALARTLVEERLAACVNLLPAMRSLYRWKGTIEEEQEQQLVIKTSRAVLDRLIERLQELHPYETPELLILDAAGSAAYLRWVEESVEPRR